MKYPYIKFRGKYAPIVPIKFKIKDKDEWINLEAYVDSGAGYSVFHSYVAEIVGLKLENGKEDYVTVGDGSQIKIYLHKVTISISDEVFESIIAFSRHLGIGFNVIGRLDIFDRFNICFDEKEKVVEFHQK